MVIASIFVFTITAILYFNWGDKAAISGALSTTGSFFGGFATLGAAIIAAHLFNDWRVQHNKEVRNKFALHVYDQFIILTKSILDYGFYIEGLRPPQKRWELSYVKSKSTQLYLAQTYELYNKQDKINLDISYFLDRLREYGVVTSQNSEINPYIQRYLMFFESINKIKPKSPSLEETIIGYRQTHEDYTALRGRIDAEIITPLLRGLQVDS